MPPPVAFPSSPGDIYERSISLVTTYARSPVLFTLQPGILINMRKTPIPCSVSQQMCLSTSLCQELFQMYRVPALMKFTIQRGREVGRALHAEGTPFKRVMPLD